MSFCSSLFFTICFTVNLIYQATVVNLDPLQMVLVGTVLEITTFTLEVPTGVVADLKSRRLSILVGYVLLGLGFLLEGSFPVFWAVIGAQVLWGTGWTFTSGAEEAWVADELGEDRVGEAFLRGAQAGNLGGLLGIPISVLLGRLDLALPIVTSGVCMIGLAGFLMLAMREKPFRSSQPSEQTAWKSMGETIRMAWKVMKQHSLVLVLISASMVFGLFSEGFDRLTTPHLIDNVGFPEWGSFKPVVWFGVIQAVNRGLNLVAVELVRRGVDITKPRQIANALVLFSVLMVMILVAFALADRFWLAVVLWWGFGVLKISCDPLYDTWFNGQVREPNVRATLFSVRAQMNAFGQIAGGPFVGAIGKWLSLRAALLTSGLLLSPIVVLYGIGRRLEKREVIEDDA